MRCRDFVLVASLVGALTLSAQSPAPTPTTPPPPEGGPARPVVVTHELPYGSALILGLVEGVTEFLPVSSTGHLILADEWLGLNDEKQLTDAQGRPRWIKPPSPKEPQGRPLTVKAAADAFCVIIQVGAIAAVVMLYWTQLWSLVLGVLGMDRNGARLLRNIVIAVLPAAVLGLLLERRIEEWLFGPIAVAIAAAGGAVFMIWVDRWRRRSTWAQAESRTPAELRPHEALLVGSMQCVAMWPGVSRSMMTIAGGYFVGLSPTRSAEFSFLVGLATLTGAGILKGAKTGPAMIEVFGWSPVLLGLVVAFISAVLAIKVLVALLTRFGLTPFAYYRFVLAAGLLVYLFH